MDVAAPETDDAALWSRLRGSGDAVARDELLKRHIPYARVVAATLYGRRFHDEIPFDDYLQLARLGMLEAMERFDPDRGVQFRTFASRRMHGAILNGLERMTEKQQQIAARQRARAESLQDVKELAAAQAGGELAPRSAQQLLKFVSEVGIGLAVCWMLEGTGMVEDAEAAESLPFYRGAALRQLRERVQHALATLPAQENFVLRSHYVQEIPFETIADMLQLTKGRVSQIHKQGLLRLRGLVGERADWTATF
jgi:RNA polymerase sigma factor for flagellar operon FliA